MASSDTRYRCAGCGNLTRFDVEARRHTKQFLHFSIAGEPSVEEEEVIAEDIVAVTCRWCGRADAIEEVARVITE
jgi:RNase P subunit RPR2